LNRRFPRTAPALNLKNKGDAKIIRIAMVTVLTTVTKKRDRK
jgi:hypothetical protein